MRKQALNLKPFLERIPSHFLMTGILCLYLALTFTSPFSDKHILFNLEPYPDGLFYVKSAQNVVDKQTLVVDFNGVELPATITPLYSVLLAVGYFFTHQPTTFYLVNVLLGALSLLAVMLSLKLIAKQNWLVGLGAIIYLSHLIIVWLPTVPMAENVLLTLFSFALYFYFRYQKNPTLTNLVATSLLIVGLVFSKYTAIGPAVVLALALTLQTGTKKNRLHLLTVLGLLAVGAVTFLFTQIQSGFNPLFLLSSANQLSPSYQETKYETAFYSLSYAYPSIRQYAKALLGIQPIVGQFLWLPFPLTTGGLVATCLGGLAWLWSKRKKNAALLLLLFAAQFPLLLIFYVVDQRYIILTVPILALGISYLLANVPPKTNIGLLIAAALILQLGTQVPVFRMIVANNLLQRSTAWQYEAVKVFNAQLPADSYIVTALPPPLVDLYSNHQYDLLPLSQRQEFLKKRQFIWGSEVNYNDLLATYQTLLSQGKRVFVSNAYLSSQVEFQADYDLILKNFKTQKVSEGCLGTCDLFELQLSR